MAVKSKQELSSKNKSIIVFLGMLVSIIITFSLLHDAYLTTRNFTMLFRHMSMYALTGLGLTFVIVVGHFDMSFHLVGCLAAMTTSFIIGTDMMMASPEIGGMHIMVIPAILLGVLAGIFWGVVNGIAVGRWKLPDMVTTIGVGSVAFGLAYLYSGGTFIYNNFLTSGILLLNEAEWFGLPFPVLLMLIAFVTAYMVLNRSKHGRRFYATGDNKIAAIFSGVKVKSYIIAAFAICCGLTSLAAILTTSAQGVGNVKASLNFLMMAYASVYIGIAVFKKASVIGTFCGTLFTTLMLNGFTLMSVPFYLSDLIIAITLIVAIIASGSDFKLFRRKKMKIKASPARSLP